jgi:hypothetical protein
MSLDVTGWLLLAATMVNGIGAGATLDQTIKQLPARRRLGAQRYAEYVRAADLANGVPWYAALGTAVAAVTIAAVVAGLLDDPDAALTAALVVIAVCLGVDLVITSLAAPTLRRLPVSDDPAGTIERFARLNAVRAVAVAVLAVATATALAVKLVG